MPETRQFAFVTGLRDVRLKVRLGADPAWWDGYGSLRSARWRRGAAAAEVPGACVVHPSEVSTACTEASWLTFRTSR